MLLYALDGDTCGTDEVLYLPHVEEVFGDVLLALLLSDDHGGGGYLLMRVSARDSSASCSPGVIPRILQTSG